MVDGVITVPDDVERIQVGTYNKWGIKYLYLPASFEVCYNASKYDYRYVPGVSALYDYENINAPLGYITHGGVAIYAEIDRVQVTGYYLTGYSGTVVVAGSAFADSVPETAIVGATSDSAYTSYKSYTDKVVFTGEIAEGDEATAYISYSNWLTGEAGTTTIALTSGDTLTEAQVMEAIGISTLGNDAEITAATQFGNEYAFGNVVKTHLYIDLVWGYSVYGGFTYTTSGNEATVTGYDEESAYLNAATNTVILQIPASITVGDNTYTVTAIGEGAFEDNELISHVYIPATVKTIGKNAFKNTVNVEVMKIEAGGLEVIGESAFENSGFTTIALPTANLKEVGPYAFKSSTLTKFTVPAAETGRALYYVNGGTVLYDGIEEGDYFIFNSWYLIRYKSSTVEAQKDPLNGTYIGVKVYDVQLVAIAGGAKPANANNAFAFGYTQRSSTSTYATAIDCAIRYEIMTGSVYYLNNYKYLEFGIISYIHTNAFTDMNSALASTASSSKRYYYYVSNTTVEDCWLSANILQTMDESLFEDGWWEGILKTDENYETDLAWMKGKWTAYGSCV